MGHLELTMCSAYVDGLQRRRLDGFREIGQQLGPGSARARKGLVECLLDRDPRKYGVRCRFGPVIGVGQHQPDAVTDRTVRRWRRGVQRIRRSFTEGALDIEKSDLLGGSCQSPSARCSAV